ncbi:hypothetical protein ACFQ0X_00150 [Streptomyces rectiviolaceus]|uniref:hypothetical protein n=1 Tax=Streptomyces rectiviolaceus TaxID=332591 RepID=UPI0031D0FBC3
MRADLAVQRKMAGARKSIPGSVEANFRSKQRISELTRLKNVLPCVFLSAVGGALESR